MAMSSLSPRLYDIVETISASKKFTELTFTDPRLTVAAGDWISARNCSRVCLHLIVSNASTLTANLSAFVSGIDPNTVVGVTINGARYDGGSSDVPISADGEYILDIVATSASYINPYIEISAGSCTVDLIVSGKSI